ncbi:MAG: D-alanine--D-alanine ligase [Lachnospiraceae bacterium]|nr:D-alanine--D-alanine ligase [Lachnospiraceae bacterium]
MEKQSLGIFFGGQSSEHVVSCMSAVNVIQCINTQRYDLTLVGITEEGRWVQVNNVEEIQDGTWRMSKVGAVLCPDATLKSVLLIAEDGTVTRRKIDIAFPVLHGLYGEDGTIQGLFELAGIPYVGCGVLASSISMDKLYTKIVVDTLGIRQAQYVGLHSSELAQMDACIKKVEGKLSYPVFVKPSCAGSSKGVNKASDREQLIFALQEAAKHDSKVLVEETIVGRELECAVLEENGEVKASRIGEIRAAAEFYDFDAKYYNAESKTDTNPDVEEAYVEEIRRDAAAIFKALDGRGLSRVDFFLDDKGVVFNEINTLPGFTAISMYPMLWEARGISKTELIQRLIDQAHLR